MDCSRGPRVFNILVVLEGRSTVTFDFARRILNNFVVSIHGIHFVFICVGHRKKGASDGQQVGNIMKLQLEKGPTITEKMVWLGLEQAQQIARYHSQVLPCYPHHVGKEILVPPSEIFLDLGLHPTLLVSSQTLVD